MGVFPSFRNPESTDIHDEKLALKDKNIILIGTGSVSAMYLPAWMSWFSETHPEANLRILLTPSAQGFLGLSALGAFAERIEFDTWKNHETESYHVELQQWADAFIIYPATAHYIARFALGACDSPAMLALQSTSAPILIAPALPPGFLASAAWQMHSAAITQRKNAVIIPPVVGQSSYDLSVEAYPPQSFMKVVAELITKFSPVNNQRPSDEEK